MQRGLRITLAASVNNATERARSSPTSTKAEAGLSAIAPADVSAPAE
jgi:hypothetical protein